MTEMKNNLMSEQRKKAQFITEATKNYFKDFELKERESMIHEH